MSEKSPRNLRTPTSDGVTTVQNKVNKLVLEGKTEQEIRALVARDARKALARDLIKIGNDARTAISAAKSVTGEAVTRRIINAMVRSSSRQREK